jgi:hypothetical protein
MAPASRDRISVDLRGLKAALFGRAQTLGVSPSGLVRTTLAEALGHANQGKDEAPAARQLAGSVERVRLCLRMSRGHARAAVEAAQRAGLSTGDYIGALVANVPALVSGGSHMDFISALSASSAELSTLSRNVHRLTALLRQADVEPARQYREMLDTLTVDVRKHLELAAQVLADLQPQHRRARPPAHPTS